MPSHKVVSREDWLTARRALLKKEKELSKLKDAINKERLALPMVKVEKRYTFDAPEGKVTLADLFDGRTQLFVQHFMFAPDWKEGCIGCSFEADHVDSARQHFEQHDLSFAAISRAPIDKIEAFKKRMGWTFRWVSSFNSDFNFDYHASFTPAEKEKNRIFYNYDHRDFMLEDMDGGSVFLKDADGTVYHTYSSYARGTEGALATYGYLDMAPKGRNENGPHHNLMDWVKHHDRYNAEGPASTTGQFNTHAKQECCSAKAGQ